MKRTLSVLLTALFLMSAFSAASGTFAADEKYQNGDIIEFGSYPQTQVTDEETLAALNAMEPEWISYGYYRGEILPQGGGTAFAMKPDDFMLYVDVEYDGERYRGVNILDRRPLLTDYSFSNPSSTAYFSTKGIYWFRYDPIAWRILNVEDGLLLSENILDNQPFENMYYAVFSYQYRNLGIPYPSLYAESSIRTWLNGTFWQTAFTAQEQANVQSSSLETPGYGEERTELYNESTDKVFLLSLDEAANPAYGFSADGHADPARDIKNKWTKYAFSQGPVEYDLLLKKRKFTWILRTGATFDSIIMCTEDGETHRDDEVLLRRDTRALGGIRPAIRVDPKLLTKSPSVDPPAVYQNGDIIEFGSYPQSQVTDEETLAALNALSISWQSYGYHVTNDMFHAGDDFMQYADTVLDKVRYRAVRFSQYRPTRTGGFPGFSYSLQDDNGYYPDTTYWFRYEPIRWRILDADAQLVMAESVLEAQPFSNTSFIRDGVMYKDNTCTVRLMDYEHSSIRAFLNDKTQENGFSAIAFTDDEWSKTIETHLDNRDDALSSENSGPDTYDRVFLPSLEMMQSTRYWGEPTSVLGYNAAREVLSTDYAACQGVRRFNDLGNSGYLTRTANSAAAKFEHAQHIVYYTGVIETNDLTVYDPTSHFYGVRPVMYLDLSALSEAESTPLSGSCGADVQWAFDEETGVLALTGSGAMDSLDAFDDYGYSVWKDDIQFVVAADDLTAIGAHAFEGCPVLEEAILGARLTMIGESAFADCPNLKNVTTLSNVLLAEEDALPQERKDWTLVAPMLNDQTAAFSRQYGVPLVTFSYMGSMLSFLGDIVVRDGIAYSYLPVLVEYYSDAQTVYFERLVFADIPPQTDSGQSFLTEYNGSLAMENVKVSLVYIAPDGHREDVTYARMLELLESGDYSAFKLRIVVDDDETMEETITRKLEEIFPFVPQKVLRLVSKAINFIINIFKKK